MDVPTAFTPAAPDETAHWEPVMRASQAESFAGRFLNKFGEFEIWMVDRLSCATNAGNGDKLIGQRLKAFRSAIAKQPDTVRNPDTVRALLDRLQPYIDLRAVLAHAHSTSVPTKDGDTLYIFEIASPSAEHLWKARKVIRGREFKSLQSGLADLINQLKQQTPEANQSSA